MVACVSNRWRAAATTALCLVAVGGCGYLDQFDPNQVSEWSSCLTTGTSVQAGGYWTLTGTGERSSCKDGTLEGPFNVQLAAPLHIEVTAGRNVALATPVTVPNGSFDLSGEVVGSCIDVTITEINGSEIFTWKLDGNGTSNGFSGEFTAIGPSDCASAGTFAIRVSSTP